MNSLRELTRSTGKPCSLRQWAVDRKIAFPFSLLAIMSAYAPPELWGFADLHAHPASHLAFGATPKVVMAHFMEILAVFRLRLRHRPLLQT